ncbi:MAG: GntR family transcriptional regulator [Alphaproteobacteria bacterium]
MGQIVALDSDSAYARIRALLADGALGPNQPLSERALAERVGLGRTPVREALKRLARDGLVQVVPMRGTFVRVPGIDEVREIYEVRLALEGMAAELAAERGPTEALTACAERLRAAGPRDLDAAQRLGWDFHDLVVGAARNARLAAVYESVRLPMVTLRSARPIEPARIVQTIGEHVAIYDAIAAGDGPCARRLVVEHLGRAVVARVAIDGTSLAMPLRAGRRTR